MIEVAFSSSFKKAFKGISRNKALEKKFWSRLEVFMEDPSDVRLKVKGLVEFFYRV